MDNNLSIHSLPSEKRVKLDSRSQYNQAAHSLCRKDMAKGTFESESSNIGGKVILWKHVDILFYVFFCYHTASEWQGR